MERETFHGGHSPGLGKNRDVPENSSSLATGAASAASLRGRRNRLRGLGGGSVRGSACDGPARLRLTSLRPPPSACSASMVRPVGRTPATGDPGRCGGFRRAACGARKRLRRAEPAASGRKVASEAVAEAPASQGPPVWGAAFRGDIHRQHSGFISKMPESSVSARRSASLAGDRHPDLFFTRRKSQGALCGQGLGFKSPWAATGVG
jgi:hypothetical protein